MSNALPLPWPYLPGDAAPGSFEDRVQQNMDALAIAVGGTAVNRLVAPAGTMTVVTLAIGTARKPNTARPTMVLMNIASGGQSGSTGVVTVRMDSAATPTTGIATVTLSQVAATVVSVTVPVTFVVPAGFSYVAVQTTGTGGSITAVSEYTL